MSTMLTATPGQTIGPFFGYALPFDRGNELVPPGSPGAIQLHGVVTDGHGKPVPDALLEIWQADADGVIPKATGSLRRDGWTFTGWGRASTDGEGRYIFSTVASRCDATGFGAFHSCRRLRPRPAQQVVHPGVSAWRTAVGRPVAEYAARRTPRHTMVADRDGQVCASTSNCRVRTKRFSCATRDIGRDRPVLARGSARR